MSMYTDEILAAVIRWNGILPTPSKEALKSPNGLRVFRNSFIENYIARAHPIVPGLWVLPVAAFLFSIGLSYKSVPVVSALFVIGVLSWSLLEYTLHLLLFHKEITPTTHPRVKFAIFMLHGYHHEYPNDPSRLVMPIILAWPLGAIIGFAFWLMLGSSFFYSFYSGLLIGYLAYDWMHYYTHHIRATNRAGKYMRKFHAIHHFVDHNKNFGISSPLWDWVFGKAREPISRLDSPSPSP